jgi:outer membrane autotransporter protein
MKKIVLVTATLLACAAAQAQTYVELAYTATKLEQNISVFNIESKPSAVRGIVGYEFNPNLAFEGMVAFGTGSSSITVNGQSVADANFKIDNSIGLYFKPKVKLNDNIEVFGRVGYASTSATTFDGASSNSGTSSSFSYGAGLSYAITPTISLNADYMQYLSKDKLTVNGFSFGVGYKF